MAKPDSVGPARAARTVDAGPVGAGERIGALDVLRGVAVLGILLMNIAGFGLPHPAYYNPTIWGGSTGANLWSWVTMELLFEGTMRTIFSMLFGAGVVVFTSRAASRDPARAADLYYRRTILLIGMGLVHAYILLWPGEVLYAYGVAGLFLYPLRVVSARRLITLGVVLLVVSGTALGLLDEVSYRAAKSEGLEAIALRDSGAALTREQEHAIDAWKEKREEYSPSPETLQEDIEGHLGGYFETVAHLAPVNAMVQSIGYYRWMFCDVISMMIVGMGLVKTGVLTGERSRAAYWRMVILGYAVGLTVNALETQHIVRSGFAVEAFFEAWRTYNIGRLLVAMGHIGAVMLLVRSGALGWLVGALSAVGRMALSNYLAQSVLCNLLFLGIGLGMFARLERAELYMVVGTVWAAQLIWSPLWLSRFRFGPAEWLWRSLTYGRAQPMLLSPGGGSASLA